MANIERLRGNDIGPTGITVGLNLARARKAANLSLKELADLLDARGRKISWSGISKIENGHRKVDSDELIAFSLALDISPLRLLLPHGDIHGSVSLTGLEQGDAASVWKWALGTAPLTDSDMRGFQARSLPPWLFLDVETHAPESFDVGHFRISRASMEQASDSELRSLTESDLAWKDPEKDG